MNNYPAFIYKMTQMRFLCALNKAFIRSVIMVVANLIKFIWFVRFNTFTL